MKLLDESCLVSDFVAKIPSVSGLFESLGFDVCCKAQQSLVAACAQKGLDVESVLQKMRQLTRDYAIPEGACGTYRQMLKGLLQLVADSHMHLHTENHILFPRALSLATGSSRRLGV